MGSKIFLSYTHHTHHLFFVNQLNSISILLQSIAVAGWLGLSLLKIGNRGQNGLLAGRVKAIIHLWFLLVKINIFSFGFNVYCPQKVLFWMVSLPAVLENRVGHHSIDLVKCYWKISFQKKFLCLKLNFKLGPFSTFFL